MEYPDIEDILGTGAYQIGGSGTNYGQGLTEASINAITKYPPINFGNPLSSLQQYLNRLPLEVLQQFAQLFGEDLQDNFLNVHDAVDTILNFLQPLLQDSFWELLTTFGKFVIGQADWSDVESAWSKVTEVLEDLQIAAGEFWGGVVSILISGWVSPDFADKMADLIVVYFRRTQDRATQQDLEDALDALLAEDPESDFWKFVLGSVRFSSRASALAELFFDVLGGDAEQSELTAEFHEFLDMFGIPHPDFGWLDFGLKLLPQWVKDLNGFLTAAWDLLVAGWNYCLGSGSGADRPFGPNKSTALKNAWTAFYQFIRPVGVGTALATTDNFWGTVATNALGNSFPSMSALNQIGDIFNGLVVTPINSFVQDVKDWWDSLWTPTKNNTSGLVSALFGGSTVGTRIQTSALPASIPQVNIADLPADLTSLEMGIGMCVGRQTVGSVTVAGPGVIAFGSGYFNKQNWKTNHINIYTLNISGNNYDSIKPTKDGLYFCEASLDIDGSFGAATGNGTLRGGIGFRVYNTSGAVQRQVFGNIISAGTFSPIYAIQGTACVPVHADECVVPVLWVINSNNVNIYGEANGMSTHFTVARMSGREGEEES